jgi:hypothetical protein
MKDLPVRARSADKAKGGLDRYYPAQGFQIISAGSDRK